MTGYWLTFTDGTKGYCEGNSLYDAKMIAEHITKKKVAGGEYKDIDGQILPYPSTPVIWQFTHPIHGKTPTFCHSPEKCKGRTACPSHPSCTS